MVSHAAHYEVCASSIRSARDAFRPQRIRLIVPDGDVPEFNRIAGGVVTVESESLYDFAFREQLHSHIQDAGNLSRINWYLQQFVKLAALSRSDASTILILDSDTILTQPINFFREDGSQLFLPSSIHRPYRDVLRRIFPSMPLQPHGFVSECMLTQKFWTRPMFAELATPDRPWHETLMANINFREKSGFSEYELLGHYYCMYNNTDAQWNYVVRERFGYAIARNPNTALASPLIKKCVAALSFESWDPLNPSTRHQRRRHQAFTFRFRVISRLLVRILRYRFAITRNLWCT